MSGDTEASGDTPAGSGLAGAVGSEVGSARTRREDGPLVRGEAQYTDDFERPDGLYMAILRAQYGHARIDGIETGSAGAVDGVVGVYTATDLAEAGIPGVVGPISSLSGVDDPDRPRRARSPLRAPDRPLLATDRVHYSGEPVAVVVAEDRYVAHEARDRIDVTYDRLDAVTHPTAALEDEAPTLHEDVPGNLAFDWEAGQEDPVEDAFADADRSVSVDIAQQRIAPTTMEPRGTLAEYDADADELFLYMSTQKPFGGQELVSTALGWPEERIRVVAPEVGGGFGCKSKYYPADPLAAWCAIETGRPVKWQATRGEAHRSDVHGRARTVHGELAFDDDGTARGLRVHSDANLGAYVSRAAPVTRTGSFVDVFPGQYDVPPVYCRVRGVLTNTSPVDSYRGASRPMGVLTTERLVYLAARDLGMDPVEFRRRNLITPDQFPYETAVGEAYDSGDYAATLDRALDLAGYHDLRERQADLREAGRYLGVGVCAVMDNAGTGSPEYARVELDDGGAVTVHCGTSDQGQGHRTVFAQLAADLLGVPFADVTVEEGDTDELPGGGGASGSRSIVMGGDAIRVAAEDLVKEARERAADALEVDPADLTFEDGAFSVRGAPERSLHLQGVARQTVDAGDVLSAGATRTPDATFPHGTHVAVVEVDPASGEIDLLEYVAVDDCGVQLNPLLVEGQIVGGIVNGLGQALYEDAIYDENGTLVTGSLQDYALPRVDDVPEIRTDTTVSPSPYNVLGVKGVGESGGAGSPPAVANAVADALAPFGVDHLDVPITPEDVWQAVRDGA